MASPLGTILEGHPGRRTFLVLLVLCLVLAVLMVGVSGLGRS